MNLKTERYQQKKNTIKKNGILKKTYIYLLRVIFKRSIWPIEATRIVNLRVMPMNGVLYTPEISRTGASPSDAVYTWHALLAVKMLNPMTKETLTKPNFFFIFFRDCQTANSDIGSNQAFFFLIFFIEFVREAI